MSSPATSAISDLKHLVSYPRHVEFRKEPAKDNVGKILRRALREM